MEPTDIDPTITRYVSDWLGSLGEEDGLERLEELIPLDDDEQDEDSPRPDLSVLGDLEHVLAYSNGGVRTWLLIPQAGWTWRKIPLNGALLAIDDHGAAFRGTVASFAADKRMWVEQGPWIIADNSPSWYEWPFPFNGDDWNGTHADSAFGETEWIVWINGEEDSFNLETRRLMFADPNHATPGIYLEIETAGYSMSTGEIGTTVDVDVDGGLFASSWGYITNFHGRADPGLTLDQVFEMADPENLGFTEVCRVTSEIYTRQQMLTVVQSILSDASEEDYEEIDIQCSDWSGTAAELLAKS